MRIFILIILITCLAGCKDKDGLPPGILKKDKMQEVFWNVVRAESFTTQFIKKNPLKNIEVENARLQLQIFADNNISKDEFYKSYKYYTTHVELMRNLLDSITSKSERQKYSTLYSTPLAVSVPFSLIPLPAPPLPKFIPMPIPITVQPVALIQAPAIISNPTLPVKNSINPIPINQSILKHKKITNSFKNIVP